LTTHVVNIWQDRFVTDTPKRRWRGIDPDQRQHDRRQRLLDAALELAGTQGLNVVSLRAVCTQADLTNRYFYESFTDLDALLVALYDDLVQALIEQVGLGVLEAGGQLEHRLAAGLNIGAQWFLEDPRRLRFLVIEATASQHLNARRRALTTQVAAAIQGIGHDLFGIPEAQRGSVAITARFFIGGIVEILTATVEGDLDGSDGGPALDALIASTTAILITLANATLPTPSPRKAPNR
jgi:AcrR family transcriptional regulator